MNDMKELMVKVKSQHKSQKEITVTCPICHELLKVEQHHINHFKVYCPNDTQHIYIEEVTFVCGNSTF